MRIQVISSLAATACAISACVAPAPRININDPQAVSSAIRVKHDDFKKNTQYVGPDASTGLLDLVVLRAWKEDADGSTLYQIYVKDYYSGEWRFYNSAYDSNGNRLDTTLISRDVESCRSNVCSYNEHLGVNISRAYLEKHQDSGIHFKIIGKVGEEIFFIPAGYIKAFLSTVQTSPDTISF